MQAHTGGPTTDNPPDSGPKPRLVGVNHLAPEVGDLEAALVFTA